MIRRWTASLVVGAAMVLALVACSPATLTARSVENDEPSDTTVDFYRDDESVGRLFVRVQPVVDGQVRLLIEVPYMVVKDYRLNDIALTFEATTIDPLIMLEASHGDLTKNVGFDRNESAVRLSIPDTGKSGDATFQLRFLADANAFAGGGLRLHAALGFNAGNAVADLVIQPAP
jgi:hypothetical protein